jgi:ADP-heptose:LPS heptosyltransferase
MTDTSPATAAGRILVIGPSNVGDAILMSEVIAALRQRYPAAHLTLAVGARAQAVFLEDPRVQALVDLDRFDSLMGKLRLAQAFWRYRPRRVVDLRHTAFPLLLAPLRSWRYLRRPPRRLRHQRDRYLWQLMTQVPEVALPARSSGAEPQTLTTPAGQGRPPRVWGDGRPSEGALRAGQEGSPADGSSLWVSPKDAAQVETLWRRWGLDGSRRLVIVCPGARSHIKRWTPEGFARVADRLIQEVGVDVVVAGEPDEQGIVEEILGLMEHQAHSAVGLTTIRQLGALMRRASLVLTNDSAALHLASAVRAPTVALFGPTDAEVYGPTAPRHRVVRRRLFCAPCRQALCRFSHECMRFISADEVFDAARHVLHATPAPDTGARRR